MPTLSHIFPYSVFISFKFCVHELNWSPAFLAALEVSWVDKITLTDLGNAVIYIKSLFDEDSMLRNFLKASFLRNF